MLSIMILMLSFPLSVGATSYNADIVVNLALSKVGTDFANGYCLKFVRLMFNEAYGFNSTACCAYTYGNSFIDSASRDDIPLGASVFFGGSTITCDTCGNQCGHIGIYVGDDYVVHGWSGTIQKFKIDRIISAGYPYRGWGWHGNVELTSNNSYVYENITPGDYYIKNSSTGTYLDVCEAVDANGQDIQVHSYHGGANQKYEIAESSDTGGYLLRSHLSTRVVNVYAETVVSGTNVCLWDNTGHNSQRWGFEEVDGGYIIRNIQNPNCVLDIVSGDISVCVNGYTGAQSQIWVLEEVLESETTESEKDHVWDGSVATTLQGSGTETDPYLISNGAELAYAVKNGTELKYYKLTADIYLNDTSKIDWTNGTAEDGYTPSEWFSSEDVNGLFYEDEMVFQGVIDGAGFTVYGLYYNPGNTYTAVGLIPVASNTCINNLCIKDSFVSGGRWTSALVGYGTNVTVNKVLVDTSVTVWGYDIGGYYYSGGGVKWPFNTSSYGVQFSSEGVGAVVGYADGTFNATNIASYATVKSEGFDFTYTNANVNDGAPTRYEMSGHYGGIIGTSWYTEINVEGAISICRPYDGYNGSDTKCFANIYTVDTDNVISAVTLVTDSQLVGEDSQTVLTGLDWNVWNTTDAYPTFNFSYTPCTHSYGEWEVVEEATTAASGLRRKVCSDCGDEITERIPVVIDLPGSGSEESPYLISSKEDLIYVITVGGEHFYYKLTADIYINDITKIDWSTGELIDPDYNPTEWFTSADVPSFNGIINGDGHVIYGLYIKNTSLPQTEEGEWDASYALGTGLFPEYEKVSITGLGIDNAYMEYYTNYCFGAIFGMRSGDRTAQTTVDQCYVGKNVTLKGYDVSGMFGGGVTKGTEIVVTNSYVLADLQGTHWVGAFVADTWKFNSEIPSLWVFKNCYTISGKFIGKVNVGPANGSVNIYATAEDAYDTTVINTEDIVGSNAQQVMTGLDWDTVYITTDNGYPTLRIFADSDNNEQQTPSVTLSFSGASLTLHSNLAINYKVDKTLFEEVGYTEPYVVFKIGDTEFTVSEYTVSGDYYVFDFSNIAPHQIGDTVYATLYAAYNGVKYASEVKEYGVSAYCYNMLNKYNTSDYAELRTLLVDLLNYGTQSQIYMDYKTDRPVNAALTEEQAVWGTSDAPDTESALNREYATVENPEAHWAGAGLNLKNSVTIRLILTAESIDGLEVRITDGTSNWTVTSDRFETAGNYYYVYFSGFDASQMNRSVYVTVYKDDQAVSNTLRYSIESYAHAKIGGADTALSELLTTMIKYGNSAYAFKN